MGDQSSSDPLPYVQVDRAVMPAASMLAGQLGVTVQHAIGSLVQWWQLCGDPRELERILRETPDGEDPEVLLPPAEAVRRLCLAAGRPVGSVECASLEALGLVEDRGEQVRIRGMSRFFEPLLRRVQARNAASKGGTRSAEIRRQRNGTAQPGRSASASSAAQATPEAVVEATAQASPEATVEAPPNTAVSGQRSAVIFNPPPTSSATSDAAAEAIAGEEDSFGPNADGEFDLSKPRQAWGFYRAVGEKRCMLFDAKPPKGWNDWHAVALAQAGPDGIANAVFRYLDHEDAHPDGWPSAACFISGDVWRQRVSRPKRGAFR